MWSSTSERSSSRWSPSSRATSWSWADWPSDAARTAGGDEPDDHRGDQVEQHGGGRGDQEHTLRRRGWSGAARARWTPRPSAPPSRPAHLRAPRAGCRRPSARPTARRRAGTSDVHDRREPGPSAGPDVDGGAGDGGRRRDATEQRHHEIGDTLAEQLAVGVVVLAHPHRVRDGRREQALQRGQGRDRDRGKHSAESGPDGSPGRPGTGMPEGMAPIRASGRSARAVTTVATATAPRASGRLGRKREPSRITPATHDGHQQRQPVRVVDPRADGAERRAEDPLPLRLDTECRGHLLQPDDHRDPDVKPSIRGSGR